VLNLVLWSFVIALIPAAQGLGWRLIIGIGSGIGREPSRAVEDAEQPRRLRSLNPPPAIGFDLEGRQDSVPGNRTILDGIPSGVVDKLSVGPVLKA
jgi:hypothetical protein